MATNLMYIIYNQDGSIKEKNFPNYVNQGSSNVNRIFVAIDGEDNTDYSVSGVFKLPNNDTSSVAFLQGSEKLHEEDEENTSGYYYDLTEAQTYYAGILLLSINAIYTLTENLFTYTAKITVNSTTYEAESDDSNITNGQYNSLIAALNQRADKSTTYTKTQVDSALSLKADKSDTYTKTQVDAFLDEKMDYIEIDNSDNSKTVLDVVETFTDTKKGTSFVKVKNQYGGYNDLLVAAYYQSYMSSSIEIKLYDFENNRMINRTVAQSSLFSDLISGNWQRFIYKTPITYNEANTKTLSELGIASTPKIIEIYDPQTTSYNGTYFVSYMSANSGTVEIEKMGNADRWVATNASSSTLLSILSDNTKRQDYEIINNKVSSIDSSSTDTQYPSAKCVFDNIKEVEDNVYTKSETNSLLNTKQNTLTFDDTPTIGSSNPVSSNGIREAINNALSSVITYKGSVATYADLPSSNVSVGDCYNVIAVGKNYAWNGTSWDELSGLIDLTNYQGNVGIDGNLTANSIIENMSGYSYDDTTASSIFTPIYIGAVKTGNKLTCVWYGTFTFTDESNLYLGRINIPRAIGDKLVPISYDVIQSHITSIYEKEAPSILLSTNMYIAKANVDSNRSYIIPRLYIPNDADNSKEYAVRIEATFLLSDNLAE